MYFDDLAELTRDHMREHLPGYLEQVRRPDDKLTLSPPRTFEVTSVLGGRLGIRGRDTLPALSIDAHVKGETQIGEDLFTFLYNGRIQGLVGGGSAPEVEKLARRYAAACEMFLREHRLSPLSGSVDAEQLPFTIMGMGFARAAFFGAAHIKEESQRLDYWLDGFAIDLSWLVSEEGPYQHEGTHPWDL